MRIKTGTAYVDGEGREWFITHFNAHGAVGTCAHRVVWRTDPFYSFRLFQENGRPVAGIGKDARLIGEVKGRFQEAA